MPTHPGSQANGFTPHPDLDPVQNASEHATPEAKRAFIDDLKRKLGSTGKGLPRSPPTPGDLDRARADVDARAAKARAEIQARATTAKEGG